MPYRTYGSVFASSGGLSILTAVDVAHSALCSGDVAVITDSGHGYVEVAQGFCSEMGVAL